MDSKSTGTGLITFRHRQFGTQEVHPSEQVRISLLTLNGWVADEPEPAQAELEPEPEETAPTKRRK